MSVLHTLGGEGVLTLRALTAAPVAQRRAMYCDCEGPKGPNAFNYSFTLHTDSKIPGHASCLQCLKISAHILSFLKKNKSILILEVSTDVSAQRVENSREFSRNDDELFSIEKIKYDRKFVTS